MEKSKNGFWWWFQALLPGWQIYFFLSEHFRFEREMKERIAQHEEMLRQIKETADALVSRRDELRKVGDFDGAKRLDGQLAELCLSLLRE